MINVYHNPQIGGVCSTSTTCQATSRYGACYNHTCKQSWRCPIIDRCVIEVESGPKICSSLYECDQGYFCDLTNSSTCINCLECLASDANFCITVCTTDFAPNNKNNNDIQLSYIMAEISATSGTLKDGIVQTDDLRTWIPDPAQSGAFIEAVGHDLTVANLVHNLGTRDITELLCPPFPIPNVTLPGCPCSRFRNVACPAGYWCSIDAYRRMRLPSDEVLRPNLYDLGALCVPCEDGFECDQGTFDRPTRCRAGRYCPAAQPPADCPSGSYCVPGSARAASCDLRRIGSAVPMKDPTLYEFIASGSTPLVGNYCPAGSDTLTDGCPGGYYCPNATVKIDCPPGYYCSRWSVAPTKCAPLMRCPANSDRPQFDPIAFVIFGTVFVVICLVWFGVRWIDALIRGNRFDARYDPDTELQGFSKLDPVADVRFGDVVVALKNKRKANRTILNGISGRFVPSGLNVILGPSGSGKSTLLHVLRGAVPRSMKAAGTVAINNQLISGDAKAASQQHRAIERIKASVGFVPQDDILHPDLTVFENMYYSGLLAFQDRSRVRLMVLECLHMLQLESVQDNLVGGRISGGQKKRVNIGFEVIRQPPVIYLDEPTSGLDAAVSHDIICMMRHVGRSLGICMVAVVHQPRYKSFQQFDRVMLLSSSGGIVYLGGTDDAVVRTYFTRTLGLEIPGNDNPADVIIDLIGAHDDAWLEREWKQHASAATGEEAPGQGQGERIDLNPLVPRWSQLIVHLKRGWTKYLRLWYPVHMTDFGLLIMSALIMGLVHGTGWSLYSFPSNAAIVMTVLSILSTITHLRTFIYGRIVWNREVSNGASVLAYFMANNLIDVLRVAVAPAIMLSIYYYLTLPSSSFAAWYVTGLCVSWCSSGLAYLVSVSVPESAALMTGVFIALIMGAFLNGLSPSTPSAEGTFLEVVLTISYNRWAVESLSTTELWEHRFTRANQVLLVYHNYGYCGQSSLSLSSSSSSSLPLSSYDCGRYIQAAYGIMIGFGAITRLFAFVILKLLN